MLSDEFFFFKLEVICLQNKNLTFLEIIKTKYNGISPLQLYN